MLRATTDAGGMILVAAAVEWEVTSELTTDGGVVPVVVERVVTSSVESSDHLTSLHTPSSSWMVWASTDGGGPLPIPTAVERYMTVLVVTDEGERQLVPTVMEREATSGDLSSTSGI